MNKFFITLLAACIFTATASAQSKGTTQFGINAGLNLATVTTSEYNNDDYRTGFNLGVSLDHYFSESWSIKVKAVYDQKGWKGFLSTGTAQYNTTYKLDYITIPVMANWHFGHTKNWYLNFGPYIGILLNAKESTTGQDLKDAFNTTDAGLDLGIGIKFPVAEKPNSLLKLTARAASPIYSRIMIILQ